ncbi:MAG: OmpA family protein, partial [Cyclobacteriaceae bacterium]
MNTECEQLLEYPQSHKRMRTALILGAIVAALALSGCVSQKKYDAALQDIARLTVDSTFQDYKLTDKEFEKDGVIFKQQRALETKSMKFDSLQRLVETQEKGLAARRDLINKLRNSEWEANEKEGQIVIQLKNDLVFASGKSELSSKGKEVVKSISVAIGNVNEPLDLWVIGHTDSQPFETEKKDNWELSSERALAVVRELVNNNIEPSTITASAKSKYDPRAPNKNGLTQLLNRRTEIIIVPRSSPYVTLV